VRQPGVPQLADDFEAVVDDRIAYLGLAQLGGAVEELGDQQVLPLRCQLHEAIWRRGRQSGITQYPQRVVLLLHQPPDGMKRLLVLQAAVE
jgi:hypothetical protein